ncbi:MAG: hypothetical protein KBD01_01905 [Acidobacteria bacterium]|nr:hypothetical protein [Acidobacteriota bacterium]
MGWLVRMGDAEALDPAIVGHKFRSLAWARREGFPVPVALAIGAAADARRREAGSWPAGLREDVLAAARELDLRRGLSVRSSGTQEDLAGASFAGQYATVLDVRDPDRLLAAVERCWASASSEVVASYRGARPTQGGGDGLVAVILQTMVPAVFAGVAFSRDPMAPARREVVIEATPGLGDSLVSGHGTPCRVRVDAAGEVRVEDAQTAEGAPPEAVLHELARWARRLEDLAGAPQDLEWALDGEGRLWLLQVRAITTLDGAEAPPGVWTRAIANDLWADRLTPFEAELMLRNVARFDMSRMARASGVPVVQPAIAAVGGYLYVNCESLAAVLSVLPPRWRPRYAAELFPPGHDPRALPAPPLSASLSRALRGALLGVREPALNPALSRWLTRRRLRRFADRMEAIERLPEASAREALAKVEAAVRCFGDLQEANQAPYFLATLFTLLLKWLVTERAGAGEDVFLQLMSGGAENVTSRAARDFSELAERLRPEIAGWDELPPTWEDVRARLSPGARAHLDRFLREYGCRSRQRTLSLKRWVEDPAELLGMLQAFLRSGPSGAPAAPARDADALRRAGAGLPLASRLALPRVARLARRYLDLREDLRFVLDRALYLMRRSLVALGGTTGLGELVLFLSAPELRQLVTGELAAPAARERAAARRSAFLVPREVPTFLVDGRPIEPLPDEDGWISGIGTSPGRATGRARIVHDPTRIAAREGDILVARNTDPGWTPILAKVRGVVVEEGGLLNHCSIVARELGIPAVVGVRHATERIPDEARITIDGALGKIRLET